ncbi:MAG TPA: DNA-directed RNA polymerase subunit omega [Hyphomonadaceae bacterium]|nr:DNA-directed RNA polymerase subunit omega [Hyphomonadaceae bacterium]
MIEPKMMGRFEFVRLSSLRAAQLIRGCTARVPEGYKRTTTAQREIAARKVCELPPDPAKPSQDR